MIKVEMRQKKDLRETEEDRGQHKGHPLTKESKMKNMPRIAADRSDEERIK